MALPDLDPHNRFAVCAVALLAALLVVGSLSDFVGRKPVVLISLAAELIAMLMFVCAPSIGWVIAARAVQGLATGAATIAFTAALIELAPPGHSSCSAVVASMAPTGGLGAGALIAGLVVQLSAPSARTTVFAAPATVIALALVALPFISETARRQPGALSSLVPQVSVPPGARREFGVIAPVLVAAWMLAGLFLGLVPTILRDLLGRDSGLLNGVTVFLEPGAAAVTGLNLGRMSSRRVLLVGVLRRELPLLWIGGLIGGVGFGASFSGALRTLAPLGEPHQRAGLVAAVYSVAYLAFGIPVIAAGLLDTSVGLLATVISENPPDIPTHRPPAVGLPRFRLVSFSVFAWAAAHADPDGMRWFCPHLVSLNASHQQDSSSGPRGSSWVSR